MIITDLETWLRDFHDQKIFRIWKKKTIFTPEEMEKKYIDQETSEYVGDFVIVESIELPNKDVVFGMRAYFAECEGDEMYSKMIEYIKLSDIDQLVDVSEIEQDAIQEIESE